METAMTEDMQKIKNIFVSKFREETRIFSEVKVICELYGKNNKQLDSELDKSDSIRNIYEIFNRVVNEKQRKELEAALKGLRLDYDQILSLAKEIEKALAEIVADDMKLYASHKTKAKDILEDIRKKDAKAKYGREIPKGISPSNAWKINASLEYITGNNRYNEFGALNSVPLLFRLIFDGVLRDSFLEKTVSPLEGKGEFSTLLESGAGTAFFPEISLSIGKMTPETSDEGVMIFEVLRNAVKKPVIERKELEQLVEFAQSYLRRLSPHVRNILCDIADRLDHYTLDWLYHKEKLNHTSCFSPKHQIIKLIEKHPKLEDFERQIDALSTRLAYYVYHEASIARSLYMEWRRSYLSQMDELFKNSRILAERLRSLYKDEKISDGDYKKSIKNISVIEDITSIGQKKMLSLPNKPIDSIQKIKEAYKSRFMKVRASLISLTNLKLDTLMLSRASEPCASATFDAETKINACAASTLAETKMTEDMLKIRNIIVNKFKKKMADSSEERSRSVKLICKLYGKDNKKLNDELSKNEKDDRLYIVFRKIQNEIQEELKASHLELKLDYNQVLPLTREINKALTEIFADNMKPYVSYKARAKEILRDIHAKEVAQDDFLDKPMDGISHSNVSEIRRKINYIPDCDRCNELDLFNSAPMLFQLIADGLLKDSFLQKTTSPLEGKDEKYAVYDSYYFPDVSMALEEIALDMEVVPERIKIFDDVKNAVKNTALERKELAGIVGLAASHLESLTSGVGNILCDAADRIDHYTSNLQYEQERLGFSEYGCAAVEVVRKYPKLEDFEKQIDALSARLAHRLYYEANTARSLYAEWRRNHLSQVDEFFKNSRILAERLYNIDGYGDTWYSIATIREITSIGLPKILLPNHPIDSQEKIKEAYKNRFMKMREIYLRRMRGKL
ncbi:hypothetical protein FACS189472_05210 [Alphaproteobacteria bacterium]|nr:hypothetical protein FACS189472_05210 [Alphaproteobacteria bacterium]